MSDPYEEHRHYYESIDSHTCEEIIALTERAEAAEAQVAAVRKLLNVWGPREATDATHAMYKELQAALDGDGA